jgi:hypothetical protein
MNSTDFASDVALSVLIANLHLSDIDEINLSYKGKARANVPLSDEELAFQLQAENFRELVGTLEDRRFAESLGRALDTDEDYLAAFSTVELGAHDDHAAALALSSGQALPPVSMAQRALEDLTFPSGS